METNINYVVTHGGKSHRDDFLASAIALALGASRIKRRDPTVEELKDPTVLVLDVGGQHDESLSNFDHHHLDRSAPPTCALSLYLRALGLEVSFRRLGWLDATELLDSKGPMAYGRAMGLSSENVFKSFSPVEAAMFAAFSERLVVREERDTLGSMMRLIGERLLHEAMQLDQAIDRLRAVTTLVDVAGVAVMVTQSKDTMGSREFRKEFAPQVAVAVSWDDRGEGWTLFRYDDDPRVDFSLLVGNANMAFIHAGGFIGKTHKLLPMDEVLELVRKALK